MKVKEESEKAGLKLSVQKANKIMVYGLIASQQIDGETMETVTDFIFLGSKISLNGDCSHEIKRHFLLGRPNTSVFLGFFVNDLILILAIAASRCASRLQTDF